jgi:hypothetical protein
MKPGLLVGALVVCFSGSFAVGEHGFFGLRKEMVSRRVLGWYAWVQAGYTLNSLKHCFLLPTCIFRKELDILNQKNKVT